MYRSAFKTRDDLKKYEPNALLLFALILKYSFEDIETIASEAITDGSGDKKADLVYVNNDEGYAIVAQGYCAKDEAKKEAPANKASDLNTAVGWLLNRDEKDLPEDIKSASIQLKNALESGEIKDFYIWYVHNLPESTNVNNELLTVEKTARSILQDNYPKIKDINVKSLEVGRNTLNEWYQSLETPILINDKIDFKIEGGFDINGDLWSSFSTAISGKDLYNLFKKYDKKIFSANVRDYLGSRKSDSNINNGIKTTADSEPKQFFVYNNGITIITHNIKKKKNKVILTGISIVNGAQTTGSIGTLKKSPEHDFFIPARIIKCNDKDVIQNIVRYNNSQNKITATDFRSNDVIQNRLRKEFSLIDDAEYHGGRRGGIHDAIKRTVNLIPADTAAQALSAFHQKPNIAYNRKSDIWKSDELYSSLFNEKTKANHIIFVYSLFLTINDIKFQLKKKPDEDLLDIEKERLSFLRLRGANYMFITALSHSLEAIIKQSVPNKFRISFGNKCGITKAKKIWYPVVNATIAFCEQLEEPTKSSLKNNNIVESSKTTFRSLINATTNSNADIYKKFSDKIKIS